MLSRPLTIDIVREHFKSLGFALNSNTHKNSVCSHLEDEQFDLLGEYAGSLKKPTVRMESNFRKSNLYELAIFFHEGASIFSIPKLHPYVQSGTYVDSFLAAVRQMSECGEPVFEQPFIEAANLVYSHIMDCLQPDDLKTVKPLTIEETIRGTSRTNPINLNASCGFGMPGKKKYDLVCGTYEEPMFTAEYSKHLMSVLEYIDSHGYTYNIATATLKDEIIKQTKIDDGLERVFFAGNVDFLILCRMYLSPLMDIFTARRDKLFGQIGMNAIGEEFTQRLLYMYDRIMGNHDKIGEFLYDQGWIDTDYDKYDKRLLVLGYGTYVMWKIFQQCPFYQDSDNKLELERVKSILKGFSQYIMIIGSDVFIMHNKMPSGVYATATLNCICECILEVLQFYYCFYLTTYSEDEIPVDFVSFGRKKVDFFKQVSLINYGDDNLKFVHPDYRYVYKKEKIESFAAAFCIIITAANKGEDIHFKRIQETVFLKRTPTWDPMLKVLMGVLSLNSITRSLCFTDSDDPNWERDVKDQALRELSFHPYTTFALYNKLFYEKHVDMDDQDAIKKKAIQMTQYDVQTEDFLIGDFCDVEYTSVLVKRAVSGQDKMNDELKLKVNTSLS